IRDLIVTGVQTCALPISRHRVWVEGFRLAARLVTCGEYLRFMDDGGYRRPEFWLSDGWATCQARGWAAPLYWERDAAGRWRRFKIGRASCRERVASAVGW